MKMVGGQLNRRVWKRSRIRPGLGDVRIEMKIENMGIAEVIKGGFTALKTPKRVQCLKVQGRVGVGKRV